MTRIEWTRGDDGSPGKTWNPTVGCSRISPGCDHCYAIGVAYRAMQPAHRGLTTSAGAGQDWTGQVRCFSDRLAVPLRRRKPTRWGVAAEVRIHEIRAFASGVGAPARAAPPVCVRRVAVVVELAGVPRRLLLGHQAA